LFSPKEEIMKLTTKITLPDARLIAMLEVKDDKKFATVVLASKNSIRLKLNEHVDVTQVVTVTPEELNALKIGATVYFNDEGQATEVVGGKITQEKQSNQKTGSDAKLSNKF
jgi:hypothetical protein